MQEGKTFEVENPYTEEIIAEPYSQKKDVDRAVLATKAHLKMKVIGSLDEIYFEK